MTDTSHLTSGVLAAVLGAALLHALWNSLVKSADDKFLSSALGALWCGVAAFAAALVLPWPSRAAAPFIAASALMHIVYFLLVGRLYRNADLSVAYPIMRGLAPLIAALIALATLGEAPGPVAALGVAILVCGVVLMGLSGLAHGRIDAAGSAVAAAGRVRGPRLRGGSRRVGGGKITAGGGRGRARRRREGRRGKGHGRRGSGGRGGAPGRRRARRSGSGASTQPGSLCPPR